MRAVFIWFYVILNTFMLAESIGYWSVVFGWPWVLSSTLRT